MKNDSIAIDRIKAVKCKTNEHVLAIFVIFILVC